jgi:pantetheine-phosphate adenylyltransferase
MKPVYVYPGTFSPPTFGHLSIVRQAAAIFSEVIILCSENPKKEKAWFTPEECKELWKTYALPKNVKTMTQEEFKLLSVKSADLIIVRGLRNSDDLEQEKEVMLLNRDRFGIKKYFYIFGPDRNQDVSSSKVRQEAANLKLKNLSRQVSPLVISALLEKVLRVKNIFLVVGRPGSGKSTLLKMLGQMDPNNYCVNTDDFNQQLKPLLIEKFCEEDLIKVALKDEERMKKVIAKPWFGLLTNSLKRAPAGSNIFVEIAYGLQTDKLMFRFVGGKIIYIGCDDEKRNLERVISRETPQLVEFIQKIPNRRETVKIAKRYRLSVSNIDTDCSLEDLGKKTKEINDLTSGGLKDVYDL